MRLLLSMAGSPFHCEVTVEHGGGCEQLLLRSCGGTVSQAALEITGSECTVTVLPVPMERQGVFEESARSRSVGELLKGAVSRVLHAATDHLLLRVGCCYRVTESSEDVHLELCPQAYVADPIPLLRLTDAAPVVYSFFTAHVQNGTLTLTRAFAVNREDLLRAERSLMLLRFSPKMILAYPLRMGRIRRLSRGGRLRRVLKKHRCMSEEERSEHLRRSIKLL